jgi:RNA-dependent RNA polymerase
MNKFSSNKNKLDIINIADYIPCNLNRQIIIILTALGIQDSVFIKLQDLMLNQLNKILIDNNVASNYILKYYKSHYSFGMSNMIGGKLDFTLEPFFR